MRAMREARDLPTLVHAYRSPWPSDGKYPRTSANLSLSDEDPLQTRFRFESEWLVKGAERGVKQGQWPQIPSFRIENLQTVRRISFPYDSVAFAESYRKAETDPDYARDCRERYTAVMLNENAVEQPAAWGAGERQRPRLALTQVGRSRREPSARPEEAGFDTLCPEPEPEFDDAPFATAFNNDRYVVRRPAKPASGRPRGAPAPRAESGARRAARRSEAEAMSIREMCQRVLRTRRLRLTGKRP